MSFNEDIRITELQSRSESPRPAYVLPLELVSGKDTPLVGGKAANLGILIAAGFQVPKGYAITTDAYKEFLLTLQVPEELTLSIKRIKEELGGSIAIRSSANCEDSEALSMAGVFESYYVYNDDEIEIALLNIYSQASSLAVNEYVELHGISKDDIKMGLVVQKLIQPDYSGVIYSSVNSHGILVQYIDGFGSALVDGETHGSSFVADRNSGVILDSSNFEARPISINESQELLQVTKEIELLYNGNPQDIEFAVQDHKLFILQSRRMTRPIEQVTLHTTPEQVLSNTKNKLKASIATEKRDLRTSTAVFSNSNFIELLPNPAEMDFGIFAYIFTGSDGIPGAIQIGRMDMGYPLNGDSIGLMQYIGGRPYSSIARDAATFYAGFPATQEEYFTTLVQEYLDTLGAEPNKGLYPEMGLYLQDPTLADLQERYGEKADAYFVIYQDFLKRFDFYSKTYKDTFLQDELPAIRDFMLMMKSVNLEQLATEEIANYSLTVLEHLRTQSCRSFVKAARLGFYYSQRLQNELKQRFGYTDEQAENTFAKLSQGLSGSMITDVNVRIAQANSIDEAYALGYELVGHYSTGEMLQIRHPRLSDDLNALQMYVDGIYRSEGYVDNFIHQQQERERTHHILIEQLPDDERTDFNQVVTSAQTYMALRETVKYYFTVEYGLVRNALELLQNRLQLTPGDIYHVYPREIAALVNNPDEFRHIISSRRKDFVHYQKIDLPNVIRESDIDAISLVTDQDDELTEAVGSFLAEGPTIEIGVLVNLDEFESPEAISLHLRRLSDESVPVILAASQMNLGHDPFIAAAAGLIIENAGIVSHGAQRARELGRGAIGGIKSRRLKTGTYVYFDPTNRVVRKVE